MERIWTVGETDKYVERGERERERGRKRSPKYRMPGIYRVG